MTIGKRYIPDGPPPAQVGAYMDFMQSLTKRDINLAVQRREKTVEKFKQMGIPFRSEFSNDN